MRKILWNPDQLQIIKDLYPDHPTKLIADRLGFKITWVYNMASKLGLKKSDFFQKTINSERNQKIAELGKLYQFKKGIIPWSKGKKRAEYFSPDAIKNFEKTQFPKGNKPFNWKPYGSTRINRNGYIEIKHESAKWNWRLYHQLIYEQNFGQIPENMNVMFLDGNRQNCDPSNLVLRTKSHCMKLNTIRRYPEELQQSIRLVIKLNHIIIKKEHKNNPL